MLVENMMSYNYSGMHSVVGPEVSKVTDIGHSAQCFLSRKDTALADTLNAAM